MSGAGREGPAAGRFGCDLCRFGDFTKKMVKGLTGKDEYKFGDITKTLGKRLFGGKDD